MKDDDSARSLTYATNSLEFFRFDNVCPKKDDAISTLSCSLKSKKRKGRNEWNKRSIQKKMLHQAEAKDFKNNRVEVMNILCCNSRIVEGFCLSYIHIH